MAFGTVRLTPNMDMATLVTAINQNFAQLENLNVTQITKDETGTNRILIGRAPNGKYVIAITKPGKDVVKSLQDL